MDFRKVVTSVLAAASLALANGCSSPPVGGAAAVPPPGEAAGTATSGYSLLSNGESLDDMITRLARDNRRDWASSVFHSSRVDLVRRELQREALAGGYSLTSTTAASQPGTADGSNPQLIDFFTNLAPPPCDGPGHGNGQGDEHGLGHGQGNANGLVCAQGLGNGGSNNGNGGETQGTGKAKFSLAAAPQNYGLTAPLVGKPAPDGNGHIWYLTEDGQIFRYNSGSGAAPFPDFKIRDTLGNVVADSFKGASLNVWATGVGGPQVGFVCSAAGYFYAINMNPDSLDYGKTGTREFIGAVPAQVGYTPPVFFDNAFSGGANIEAYALTNPGGVGTNVVQLNRFVISKSTANKISSLSTPLAPLAVAPFTEFAMCAPFVWQRQLSYSTMRYHSSGNPAAHRGGFYQVNLGTWITSGGVTLPTVPPVRLLNRPVVVPPAIELNASLQPAYVFQPAGNYLHFINLVAGGNTVTNLNALVLNPGDPDVGDLLSLNFGSNNEQPARVDFNGGILGQPNILWKPDFGSGSFCVVVLNGNALWKVSMPVVGDHPWYGPAATPATNAARESAFSDLTNWTYTKTQAGVTFGTVDAAGKYVANPCFPTAFFPVFGSPRAMLAFMDNWGGPTNSQHVFAQVYNVNNGVSATVPPVVGAGNGFNGPPVSGDLHLSPPPIGVDEATELAGQFMTYDWRTENANGIEIVFNTSSWPTRATPSAALWRWLAPLD